MIKIIIIADPLRGQSHLKRRLSFQRDFKILGFGRDEYDALRLASTFRPDIVLIDLYRDDIRGIEIAPLIRGKSPSTKTIILTSFDDEEHIGKALFNGITGYLLRNGDYDKIVESIRTIYKGGIYYTPKITSRVFVLISELLKKKGINHSYPPRETTTIPPTISEIELRIMSFIGAGWSDKEIAENLRLKPGTIRNYISSAIRKAGLRNRTEIAIYALKWGLIEKNV
jgi:DNA-binding NarL/FixJ family response regulator